MSYPGSAAAAGSMVDQDDLLFDITFNQPKYFKGLIEYLCTKNGSIDGCFILYPDRITFKNIDENKNVINEVQIAGDKIGEYRYNMKKPWHALGLDISRLKSFLAALKTKQKINICTNTENSINLIFLTSENQQISTNVIPTKPNLFNHEWDLGTLNIPYYVLPNCEASVENFAGQCKHFFKLKAETIVIECFQKGMTFSGVNSGENDKANSTFGDCPPYEDDEDRTNPILPPAHDPSGIYFVTGNKIQGDKISLVFPLSVINYLSKMSNIASGKDVLKIFFYRQNNQNGGSFKYIRIFCPVGDLIKDAAFGILCITIMNREA